MNCYQVEMMSDAIDSGLGEIECDRQPFLYMVRVAATRSVRGGAIGRYVRFNDYSTDTPAHILVFGLNNC
jgi:hypothetical protein